MAYPYEEDQNRRPYLTAMPSLREAMGPIDNFASGVRQGWNTGQQMFDAGVAGLARSVGATGIARDWEQSADEQAMEAAQYANPDVQQAPWREGGGGWGNVVPWAVNRAGQLVGGVAPLVAGGVAGMAAAPLVPEAFGGAALASGLGMGLASYPQAVGANYQAERDANAAQGLGEVTPEQAQSAAAWGVPSAALNAFAPTKAIGVGQTASQMASRTMLEAAKDVTKVGIDNALATGGQKAIEHSFRPDMSDEEKSRDMLDSVVEGFLGGAGMGAAGEGAGRIIKSVRANTPTQDLDAITKSILEPEKAAQDVQDDGRNAQDAGQYEEAPAGQEGAAAQQGVEGEVSFLDEGQEPLRQEVARPSFEEALAAHPAREEYQRDVPGLAEYGRVNPDWQQLKNVYGANPNLDIDGALARISEISKRAQGKPQPPDPRMYDLLDDDQIEQINADYEKRLSDWKSSQSKAPDVPRQYLVEAERALRDGSLDQRMAAAEQGGDTLRSRAFQHMKNFLVDENGWLAWHGSPHKYDEVDMSKVGTGEGAQAYGHGYYVAERPDVAQKYKEKLSEGTMVLNDETFDPYRDISNVNVSEALKRGGLQEGIATARKLLEGSYHPSDPRFAGVREDLNKLLFAEGGALTENPGYLYKLDIKPEKEKFLDWDTPLHQQDESVRRALGWTPEAEAVWHAARNADDDALLSALGGNAQYKETRPQVPDGLLSLDKTGAEILGGSGVFDRVSDPAKAARLKELGIPGIKYFDGGSRKDGEGTRNYVLFNDKDAQILERNGEPVKPITRDVGGAVAHFAETPNGIERLPSPADLKQPIDRPAGTPPIEGPKGVAPAMPPLPPRTAIPPSPSSLMSRAAGVLERAKDSAASFVKDETGSLRLPGRPIPMEAADGTPLRTPTEIDGALKRFLRNVDFGSAGDAARKLGLYVTTNHHHDEMYGHIMPSQLEYSRDVAHRAAISQRMQADAMGNQARINSFAKNNAKLAEHTRAVERAYKLGMDPSKPWEAQPQRVQKGDLYETYKSLHRDFQKSYNALRSAPGGMEMHDVMREQYQTHWMSKPAAVLYTLLNDTADLPEELRARIVDPSERLINDPEAAKTNSFVSKLMADSLEQNLAVAKAYLDAQEKVETKKILGRTKTEKAKEEKFMAGVSDPELTKDFGKLLKTGEEYKVKTGSAAPESALRDLVNDIERQKGMLKDVPYSALVRSGKYGLGFRLAKDEAGNISNDALQRIKASFQKSGFNNVVIEPLANQDYVFVRSDNKTQINNLKELIRQHVKDGDVLEKDFQAGSIDTFSKSPAASKTIDKIIRQIESDDRYTPPEGASDELKKSLETRKRQMVDALRNIAVDFLPEASMAKYDEHRSYIPGFEADPLQSMAKQSIENAQHVANLIGTYRVNKSLAKMRAEWEAAKNPMSDSNKYEPIMAALYARNAGKEEARGMQLGASPFEALQSLNYSYYLGLNPSFGIIQMSQIPMYVVPELGKRYGFMKATTSIGKTFVPAMKVLAAVAKEAKKVGGNAIADMPITIDALKNAGLDDETARFMIHMVNSGGIDTGGLARSLGHIAENRVGGNAAVRAFDNATRWSSAIGYYGETLSRIQTALMAKEVFKSDKKNDLSKPEDWNRLINHTHKVLNEALFDYSNENRATGFSDDPRSLLGRSTKLAFAFQAYWMMAIEKQYREIHRLITDADPENRKEAAKFLLGHLGAVSLVAGSLGIPGMSAFQKAYEKFEDWRDPESGPHDMRESYSTWLEHTLGSDIGDAVAYGAPRLIGQDWSKRTGEQDFAPIPTFLYDRGSWKDAFNKWALGKEGPAQGALANVMTAIDKFNAGDTYGGMASILPAAGLRNAMNTARAVSTGHYRDSRGHTIPNVEPTTGGIISGFAGFTPKNLAREREENSMLHRYDTAIEYDARNLVMPMVDALRDGDQVAFNRMLPKAREFERMHPGHKIVDRAQETFKREYKELNTAEKTGVPYQRWKDDPKRKERASRYVEQILNSRE